MLYYSLTIIRAPLPVEPKLTEVLSFFDLGTQSTSRRAGGFANENYFVTTDKGEYVVKVLREHAAANVVSEIPYLKKLEEVQFPVAQYISNDAGDCVFEADDIAAVVMHRHLCLLL